MEIQKSEIKNRSYYLSFFIAGIVLVAFNLRPAITSIGPLVGEIQSAVGLSGWSAGLLTSLPLLAFAAVSPIVPSLASRLHNERTLLLGLFFLIVGIAVRSISNITLLFTGTILIGVGIAICNVLLPGIVKEKFPDKVGLMTSVYTTAMNVFAAIASGISIPIAVGMGYGWQTALLVWMIPVIIALIIWFYLAKTSPSANSTVIHEEAKDTKLWQSALAWQVALFMGFQSTLYYVTIAWLPAILQNNGLNSTQAGWMLSFTQLIGLPAGFIVPIIAGKMKSQKSLAIIMGLLAVIGYGGLLIGTSYFAMMLSIVLIGISLSGSFALSLTYLGMRARDAKQASALSGMAQSIGYLLSAIGPILIGTLYDITQAWTIPVGTLIFVSILVTALGASAGRNKFV
ncbi:MFS transporter [Caldibacillus lycopersici]|uniref:MFS transporter n=1 Tax=Perspicuibacillus lycopersici TaxID=1325689 RepID=A0AAE3ISS4_9BACI|nr:MFS transporter [Perspicuibacillus lycopersici]MCU9612978.1 MFS transporter [Perspicuibacillus lycopersici]